MSYSREQLDKALMAILKNELYIQSAGRPSACAYAAQLCFMEKTPESEDTQIIREAVKDLQTSGFFNWV